MKKYGLGIIVGLIFLAYTTVLRHQHSAPVIAPSISTQSNSNSASPSTSSSATSTTTQTPTSTTTTSQYKDGNYTGDVENAYYGNVQVSVTIQSGKIVSVDFLQSPNENPNSIYVNQQADPYLKQEAIQAQSSRVSTITGATFTSNAFVQSLSSALSQTTQG